MAKKFKNSKTLLNLIFEDKDGNQTKEIITPTSTIAIEGKFILSFNPYYDHEDGYESLIISEDDSEENND